MAATTTRTSGAVEWGYDNDGHAITEEIREAMEREALERSAAMVAEGYVCGELHCSVWNDQKQDTDDFYGWWETVRK